MADGYMNDNILHFIIPGSTDRFGLVFIKSSLVDLEKCLNLHANPKRQTIRELENLTKVFENLLLKKFVLRSS